MSNKVNNNNILKILSNLLNYLYSNNDIHSIVIQPEQPIKLLSYEKIFKIVKDITFTTEHTGILARNFLHTEKTKQEIQNQNVAYETFLDGDKTLYVTIMRNDTNLSIIITVKRNLEDIINHINYQITTENNKIHDKKTLINLFPTLFTKPSQTVVITGNNVYYNNIVGLQIIDLMNKEEGLDVLSTRQNVQKIITTIEQPVFADIEPLKNIILYRHQLYKDIFNIQTIIDNNILLQQTDVFFINKPDILLHNKQAYEHLLNNKTLLLIEDNKSPENIKKIYGEEVIILNINQI